MDWDITLVILQLLLCEIESIYHLRRFSPVKGNMFYDALSHVRDDEFEIIHSVSIAHFVVYSN